MATSCPSSLPGLLTLHRQRGGLGRGGAALLLCMLDSRPLPRITPFNTGVVPFHPQSSSQLYQLITVFTPPLTLPQAGALLTSGLISAIKLQLRGPPNRACHTISPRPRQPYNLLGNCALAPSHLVVPGQCQVDCPFSQIKAAHPLHAFYLPLTSALEYRYHPPSTTSKLPFPITPSAHHRWRVFTLSCPRRLPQQLSDDSL